jgi:hypothetical protein
VQQLLSSYTDICNAAATGAADTSDEFLYGRAGTLFGALLLRQQLGAAAVPDAAVGALVASILASGGQALRSKALDKHVASLVARVVDLGDLVVHAWLEEWCPRCCFASMLGPTVTMLHPTAQPPATLAHLSC